MSIIYKNIDLLHMEYYFGGIFAGISQSLIGHPFNTIKVHYQNNNIKNLKIKNLYRGLSYPLLTSGLLCSINFGTYNYFNNTYSHFVAGSFTGFVLGIIETPIDHYKIKKQLFIKKSRNPFVGTMACVMREVPTFGIYFSSYNYFLENDYSVLMSGGLSGLLGQSITYPLDVIKTRVQSGYCKNIKAAYKIGNLYRGYSICLLRAFPVNAIGFLSYEYGIDMYKKY